MTQESHTQQIGAKTPDLNLTNPGQLDRTTEASLYRNHPDLAAVFCSPVEDAEPVPAPTPKAELNESPKATPKESTRLGSQEIPQARPTESSKPRPTESPKPEDDDSLKARFERMRQRASANVDWFTGAPVRASAADLDNDQDAGFEEFFAPDPEDRAEADPADAVPATATRPDSDGADAKWAMSIVRVGAQLERAGLGTASLPPTQTESERLTIGLKDVAPEAVQWLWRPRIPLGKLTLIEGDPGIGKSWLTCAIASAVAAGAGLPGMPPTEPQSVLMLSAEDGLADTIRPRLDALGADLSRISAMAQPIMFDKNGLYHLRLAIRSRRPALIVIDPLMAFFDGGIDINRASEIRQVLAVLARLAERFKCAVLAVRHLTKSSASRAIYRGLGSIDFTAACRSVLLAGCDPENPERRALVHIKSNLARTAPALGYSIDDQRFLWTGPSTLTAERLLAAADREETTTVLDARDFLLTALAAGSRPAREVLKEARAAGISERTLRRAKASTGVEAERQGSHQGGDQVWCWRLPQPKRD